MEPLILDGGSLSVEDVEAVARTGRQVALSDEARKRVAEAAELIQRLAVSQDPVYGVNTGLGSLQVRRISPDQASLYSHNQILGQIVGLGEPLSVEAVRAAMLVRANTLSKGLSGVRPESIELLLEMLNRQVTPVVPSQGSLGSSGDLAPLSHIAVVGFDGPNAAAYSGRAWFGGRVMEGSEAMKAAALKRITLGVKEGIALTNGASLCAGMLALCVVDAVRILQFAELAAATTLEALLGASAAFDERLHEARRHPGQIRVARAIRQLIEGSDLIDADGRVQDAYSLRCIPQIIGPVWDILRFVSEVATRELNAASDNPLLFGERSISGGNFHGEPLGLAADYLKVALTEVGAVSERRVFRLLTDSMSAGLPPMLVADPSLAGLESGLMMLQYTAASLVHENQALSAPDSVHSLPTSGGSDDHNANSTTAVRHLVLVLANVTRLIAIELLTAVQALDIRLRDRPSAKLGRGAEMAMKLIRERVPFQEHDRPLSHNIEDSVNAILRQEALQALEEILPPPWA